MALTSQLTLRLSDAQRQFLRDQKKALQEDFSTHMLNWSEADVVRAIINDYVRNGKTLVELRPTGASE